LNKRAKNLRILTITHTTSQKVGNFRQKVTKNNKKREKGLDFVFFQVFSCFECKYSRKYEIGEAPAPKIAYFITTVSVFFSKKYYFKNRKFQISDKQDFLLYFLV
jgi:hypothetical protein